MSVNPAIVNRALCCGKGVILQTVNVGMVRKAYSSFEIGVTLTTSTTRVIAWSAFYRRVVLDWLLHFFGSSPHYCRVVLLKFGCREKKNFQGWHTTSFRIHILQERAFEFVSPQFIGDILGVCKWNGIAYLWIVRACFYAILPHVIKKCLRKADSRAVLNRWQGYHVLGMAVAFVE